jgi:hypothetical protein
MTKGKKTERAKRATAVKLEKEFSQSSIVKSSNDLLKIKRLSPTSRALRFCTPTILGFRCAPPQALCYRRASRAK